jgi:hypothetical protein
LTTRRQIAALSRFDPDRRLGGNGNLINREGDTSHAEDGQRFIWRKICVSALVVTERIDFTRQARVSALGQLNQAMDSKDVTRIEIIHWKNQRFPTDGFNCRTERVAEKYHTICERNGE